MRTFPLDTASSASDHAVSQRRQQVFSLPLFVGMVVCLAIVLGAEFSSGLRRLVTTDVMIGLAGLSAALAAVNIAVLAIVAVWFDDSYQQVLRRRGGWAEAMRPFRIISTISILSVVAAIITIFPIAADQAGAKAFALGIVSGSLAWSLAGTLSVVGLIFHHGEERAKLLERLRELRATMPMSHN